MYQKMCCRFTIKYMYSYFVYINGSPESSSGVLYVTPSDAALHVVM